MMNKTMIKKSLLLPTILLVLSSTVILVTTETSEAVDKVLKLTEITTKKPSKPQSKTSKKHKIKQKKYLYVNDGYLNVRFRIENGDRTRGRTMCSKIDIVSNFGNVIATESVRAGVKRRSTFKGYRVREVKRKVEIPAWADFSTLNVEITDWYCSKGFGSRLGDTLEKIAKKPIKETLRGGGQVVRAFGTLKDQVLAELSYAMKKTGGKDWQKAFDDIVSVTRLLDDKTAVAFLDGAKAFVEDGKPEHLNPITIYVAAQMESAHAELWRKAKPVPGSVLSNLPDEIRAKIGSPRYVEKSQVPEISLPHMALSDADAIVVKDVIVFRDGKVPSSETIADKYLWAHELYHVFQYKELGTQRFAERFMGEELGFKASDNAYPGVNSIERDADLFACKLVPNAKPTYITRCPM